jgi:predicted ATPase
LDEPETALSPRSQLALLELLTETSAKDHAQFIIATHSPILLACPHALIYSFDYSPVRQILYEEAEHYKIYRAFLENRTNYLK